MSALSEVGFLLLIVSGFSLALCGMFGLMYAWECRAEILAWLLAGLLFPINHLRAWIARRRMARIAGWADGWTHARNRRSA